MKHKLLMEGWRSYSLNEPYDILEEKYQKKLITHKHFLNVWEQNMLREGEELVNEGIIDLAAQAFESGKQAFGAAKDKILAAAKRVIDFLIAKVGELRKLSLKLFAEPELIIGKILSLFNAVSKWCSASPKLCIIAKGLIIATLIMAIPNAAEAGIQMPDDYMNPIVGMQDGQPVTMNVQDAQGMMTEPTAKMIYGALDQLAKNTQDTYTSNLATEAAEIVKNAAASKKPDAFQNLPELARKALEIVQQRAQMSVNADDPEIRQMAFQSLADFIEAGKKVKVR